MSPVPPSARTLWLTTSNVFFLAPTAAALWRRDYLRALGYFCLAFFSAFYHYMHGLGFQPLEDPAVDPNPNVMGEQGRWVFSQLDTAFSIWSGVAGGTLLIPLRHRTDGVSFKRADLLFDWAVLLAAFGAAWGVTELPLYGKCRFNADCENNYIQLWFVAVIAFFLLLEVVYARRVRVDPWAEWAYHKEHWGTRGLLVWGIALILSVCFACLLYAVWDYPDLHGVWHFLCSLALTLTMVWSAEHNNAFAYKALMFGDDGAHASV